MHRLARLKGTWCSGITPAQHALGSISTLAQLAELTPEDAQTRSQAPAANPQIPHRSHPLAGDSGSIDRRRPASFADMRVQGTWVASSILARCICEALERAK